MKMNLISKFAGAVGVTLTAACFTFAATSAQAQKGAGAAALTGQTLNTVKIEVAEPVQEAAKVCPKCSTVSVAKVEEGKGAIKKTRAVPQHQCPNCKTTIKTIGVGKAAADRAVHACDHCGTQVALCCAKK